EPVEFSAGIPAEILPWTWLLILLNRQMMSLGKRRSPPHLPAFQSRAEGQIAINCTTLARL
ncbi:hypothetical protein ABTC66_20180, partial [Acinetobacter baumannii]